MLKSLGVTTALYTLRKAWQMVQGKQTQHQLGGLLTKGEMIPINLEAVRVDRNILKQCQVGFLTIKENAFMLHEYIKRESWTLCRSGSKNHNVFNSVMLCTVKL